MESFESLELPVPAIAGEDGYIALDDMPGIGLELDETVARAHQYPGTIWFE